MEDIKMKIQDDSGDKEFFTIIPNYIANHSTANDQSLYFQMKKYAGEGGKCFATEQTLMRKMSIGKKAFNKSLNYLLEKRWITFVGLTSGKTRPIKTYKINNIWKMNNSHYNKISSESNISFKKDTSPKLRDTSPKQHKISAESNVEEEPYIIRTNNKKATKVAVNEIIDLFKSVNPSFERLFKNKTQRSAIERMAKQFGEDKLIKLIGILSKTNGLQYAPTITTPLQLENKMGNLKAFLQKREEEIKKNQPIII